jgi:hypothetical protein
MTPYALEREVEMAQQAMKENPHLFSVPIFHLLTVLIRHAADVEGERLLSERQSERAG